MFLLLSLSLVIRSYDIIVEISYLCSNCKGYKDSSISKKKRAIEEQKNALSSKKMCCSLFKSFDFKRDFLYCSEPVREFIKYPIHRREQSHQSETLQLLKPITEKSLKRDDDWAKAVFIHI